MTAPTTWGEVVDRTTSDYRLYDCPMLPEHWVVRDPDGAYWIVPGVGNGWRFRTPYRGHRVGLELANLLYAHGLGLPL